MQTIHLVPCNKGNTVFCGLGGHVARKSERHDRGERQATRGERPIHRAHKISPGQEGETRGQESVSSGGQSAASGGNKLFTQTQRGRDITRVTSSCIERRKRSERRTEPWNHRIGLRHQGPVATISARLGRGGKIRRVDSGPRAVCAPLVGHQLSALIGRSFTPFGTCCPKQIRRAAKAGNPAVSQEVAATAEIDRRAGCGAHFVAGQGYTARRQTGEGDIDATGIDPSKPVRAQTEGNGQAGCRDGRRAAARQRNRARHGATTVTDCILRTI